MSDILPPPYPGDFVSQNGLYRTLTTVYEWIGAEYNTLAEAGAFEEIRELQVPTRVPSADAFKQVAVMDQFYTHQMLQHLRRAYDQLLREWEEDWLNKVAIARRAEILGAIIEVFHSSWMPSEKREAKHIEDQETARLTRKQLSERVHALTHHARQQIKTAASKDEKWWTQGMENNEEESSHPEETDGQSSSDDQGPNPDHPGDSRW